MSLKQKGRLEIAALGAGLLLAVFSGGGALQVLGFLLMAAGFGLDFAWNRCPHCGEWLGRYPGKHCKSCGEEIDYNARSGTSR